MTIAIALEFEPTLGAITKSFSYNETTDHPKDINAARERSKVEICNKNVNVNQ